MKTKFTPEQYEVALELMRRRLEGMSERLVNMEKEVLRERREWLGAVQRMQNPNMHAPDAEKMYGFLQELHQVIRELLKVENVRWGLGNYSEAIGKPEKKQKLARTMGRVLDYFDWTDE